jgi:hypothetical protein
MFYKLMDDNYITINYVHIDIISHYKDYQFLN